MKVGVGVGRCLGLPLPDVSDALASAIGTEANHVESLLGEVGDEFKENLTSENFIEGGKAMGSILGDGWEDNCWLKFVTANDGTSEWVLPEVAKEFEEKGEKMLGGKIEEVGKVKELTEENENLKKTIDDSKRMDEMNAMIERTTTGGSSSSGDSIEFAELKRLPVEAEKKAAESERKRAASERRVEAMLKTLLRKVEDKDEEEEGEVEEEENSDKIEDEMNFGDNPMEVARVRASTIESNNWSKKIDKIK